jgi:hypothetical protein
MSVGTALAALASPAELYELLDPDVLWYSADVDSNLTCNGKDAVVACIERALAGGASGRWELVAERDDFVVLHPVLDPPAPPRESCLLARVRDGLIVELRDFRTAGAALAYAAIR